VEVIAPEIDDATDFRKKMQSAGKFFKEKNLTIFQNFSVCLLGTFLYINISVFFFLGTFIFPLLLFENSV